MSRMFQYATLSKVHQHDYKRHLRLEAHRRCESLFPVEEGSEEEERRGGALRVFGVAVVVVRGRRELAEDAGVAVMAEVSQVGDVELEFTAVLGQG
ncbi:hypothetical protein EYF80_018883 [Liparis tanakae]|uniref:Uncharacterized protein n=1 Tax=Liparis tanakae TaxID=230148 RepID=A0A4Z2HZ03_9TELE|nr:hypothetical protein EYF80_018883 [Liparis tanakae]